MEAVRFESGVDLFITALKQRGLSLLYAAKRMNDFRLAAMDKLHTFARGAGNQHYRGRHPG